MMNKENTATITMLSSGKGLGVYIPVVIIANQLRRLGERPEIELIESYFNADSRDKLLELKKIFHRNFRMAKLLQKKAGNALDSLADEGIQKLLERWHQENRSRFYLFSGFWIPVIKEYVKQRGDKPVKAVLCCVDSNYSPSWDLYNKEEPYFSTLWLTNHDGARVDHYIDISGENPTPFTEREDRFIVHGGGWGMGTYRKIAGKLAELGFSIDLIAYEHKDITDHPGTRHFGPDPAWSCLDKNGKDHSFPPFGKINPDGSALYTRNNDYPAVYDIIKRNKAIISKPGGATLLDSFSAATPLIFLTPFGEHEKKNGELWEHLGFGIPFEKWEAANYSVELLENLYSNLESYRSGVKNITEVIHAT